MEQLPDFFWADRLTPVRFYGYPSSTGDRIFELDGHLPNVDTDIVQRFQDLKRKCMSMELDMSREKDKSLWYKDIWDNKVVIECKTEEGGSIFIGYYDCMYSIGLSASNRDGAEPREYRYPVEEFEGHA